jgi:hypothetical protein
MEVIIEKVIDETLFKKDSWLKKFLRRIKCQSNCCVGSSCTLEPEEEIEEKKKQKQDIMDFVKVLKRKTMEENIVEEVLNESPKSHIAHI